MFTAGASAVLWPVAGWLLPQATPLLAITVWPVAGTMAAISAVCVLAAGWAVTMDRQHGLLSLLTSASGLVILGLASNTDFLPGYAVGAIMVLFAYGFVSRTRFVFAFLRTGVIGVGFIIVAATYVGTANLAIDAFLLAAMSVGTLIALRALDMQHEVARRGGDWANLQVRVGIHTGAASGGVIGRHKFAFDLWGDTVNVASRLEQHCLPGQVHVSAETWNLVGHAFIGERRGQTELRGKGTVATYLVTGRQASGGQMAPDAGPAVG